MSMIESTAPTSWKWTFSMGIWWTVRFGFGKALEDFGLARSAARGSEIGFFDAAQG